MGGAATYTLDSAPKTVAISVMENQPENNKQTKMQSPCRTVFFSCFFFHNELLILAHQHMRAHLEAHMGAHMDAVAETGASRRLLTPICMSKYIQPRSLRRGSVRLGSTGRVGPLFWYQKQLYSRIMTELLQHPGQHDTMHLT